MILETPSQEALAGFDAGICVIGSGSVGLSLARALAARGERVLVLESGGPGAEPGTGDLMQAENVRPENNFVPHTVVARQLGGTSNLWAGRCLPFDPVDFRPRPWLDLPPWPIDETDLAPWLEAALSDMDAGAPVFHEALPGVEADPAFGWEALERWSNTPKIQKRLHAELRDMSDLAVALHSTVTGFRYHEDGRIAALELHLGRPGEGVRCVLPVAQVVLAAGGNESTRLLLLEQRRRPALFGGAGGPLGRTYMGHVSGQIADITIENAALHDGLDYHVDGHGSYVRRRLVPSEALQEEARLSNVVFWPVVPPIANAAHRSGPLSAVFLGLSIEPLGRRLIAEALRRKHIGYPPYHRGAHFLNVLRDLPRTIGFAPAFLWRNKVARMRLPGFFLHNPARRYGLEYHGEHLPDPESRLTLAESSDALGQPRLRIDLRFSEADAAPVLRAHEALGAWLGRNGLGRIDYYEADPARRAAAVIAEATDGAHQIGTIRMGPAPGAAVVDGDCRAFDVPNLFVASTAVLPTSGQANPTLTAVQLGLRLAARLTRAGLAPA